VGITGPEPRFLKYHKRETFEYKEVEVYSMESLESKLDRLSHEQRREIEDFVDFLISRSGQGFPPMNPPCNPPPVLNVASLPLTIIEPAHGAETPPVTLQDPVNNDERTEPVTTDAPAPPLFQEIGAGSDRITHNYMDYGQFEHPPSLAAEAVKKVKRKIIAREEQEKPRHLLDWVD